MENLAKLINLATPDPALFDGTAQAIAQKLAQGDSNKPTQIRRFYDEVSRFGDRLWDPVEHQDSLKKALPFIRMINARVAYAGERKVDGKYLVDENFKIFMRKCLAQVTSVETLQNFRFLFEAVIGFSPKSRERSS
ncbi:MAG: type III-A CRISPR-associated protein Csm2 [Azospirillaceae bacterium]|nr:type III-A CRISPR-associated protein Csm2 [Azospirillaceae bacterium]